MLQQLGLGQTDRGQEFNSGLPSEHQVTAWVHQDLYQQEVEIGSGSRIHNLGIVNWDVSIVSPGPNTQPEVFLQWERAEQHLHFWYQRTGEKTLGGWGRDTSWGADSRRKGRPAAGLHLMAGWWDRPHCLSFLSEIESRVSAYKEGKGCKSAILRTGRVKQLGKWGCILDLC